MTTDSQIMNEGDMRDKKHSFAARIPAPLFEDMRKEAFRRKVSINRILVERLESKPADKAKQAKGDC